MRIRKLLLLAVVLAGVFFAGRAVWRALASPETKIRWRIERMVDGFNAMRSRPVLDGIARDFVDDTSSLTRDELRQLLAWLFLNETDSQNGAFLWHCDFDPQVLEIELAPDKKSAEVRLEVHFTRRRAAEFEPYWDARLEGTLAEGEDGWQWKRLSQANHRERRRL